MAGKSKRKSKRKLVPKLRFPEFRDAPGWKVTPLGDLLSQRPKYGVNAPGAPFSENLPIYLRITDIDEDGRLVGDNRVSVDIDATDDDYLQEGDIAFARTGASVGKSYRYRKEDGELVFAGFLIRVRPDRKKLIPTFLSNYVCTRQYWNWVVATSARSGQPGINGTEYESLPVPVPKASEQKEQSKIADCLSSLDALIAAESRKLAALQAHKKGLMQQLFPREGETQPRLRFPEFRDRGIWKSARLGDIATIHKGKGISKKDLVSDGRLSCIRYGELYTCYGEVIDEVVSKTNVPASQLVLSKTHDVAVPASGETKLDIATAACVLHEGIALGSDLNVIRTDLFGPFLSYYINGPLRSEIAKVAQGISVIHLYPGQLQQIHLYYPDADEQLKIAELLNSTTAQIAASIEKTFALKTHKKGLMQQLFPSVEDTHA